MKILEIVTEHAGPFKVLFEVLKDMLTETNIEFRSYPKDADGNENPNEKDCMKIVAFDPTKTILINLKLDGNSFTTFTCKKNKFLIGINLSYFYRLIKSMGKNDILTLAVDHDSKNYLQIKIDSPDEKKDTKVKLKLMDLDETKMAIPPVEFGAVITMDSQEFNKLCREMNSISEYVEIKCIPDKIIFTCKGDVAEKKTTYTHDKKENSLVRICHGYNNNDGTKSEETPEIIQGVFELKSLVLFSKCASLCEYIEIYMKNDFALVIKYTVATLGRILLCLSPIKESNIDSNKSDDDEFYSDPELYDEDIDKLYDEDIEKLDNLTLSEENQ